MPDRCICLWKHSLTAARRRAATPGGAKQLKAIAICAVICGADSWVYVELFGKSKEEWFRSFLDLPNGIPSHDITFSSATADRQGYGQADKPAGEAHSHRDPGAVARWPNTLSALTLSSFSSQWTTVSSSHAPSANFSLGTGPQDAI